jgi:hypothetical protein
MGMGLVVAAAATALSVGTALVPVAAPDSQAACNWRLSARVLYQELQVETSDRAAALRGVLEDAGVGEDGFVPASCTSGGTSSGSSGSLSGGSTGDGQTGSGGSGTGGAGGDGSVGAGGGGSPRPGTSSGAAGQGTGVTGGAGGNGNCPTTAAGTFGWGQPNRADEFDADSTRGWNVYDGEGHAGNGRRTPSAISVLDGVLTITGTSDGSSGGMAWNPGQMYGRWEGCVQSPPGADSLHSLLLLWPDEENWPVGGEVDFMEISDPDRQSVDGFLHYGADNNQEAASVDIDATQWHAWAVEWTADHIAYYVDGEQWWETTEKSHLPPGPMHLTIQLDYFGGGVSETRQHVDWVRQYDAGGTSSGTGSTSGGGSGSSSSGSSGSGAGSDSDRDSGAGSGRNLDGGSGSGSSNQGSGEDSGG